MADFTLDELKNIMRTCAGVADSTDLNSDIGHVEFGALGYDSLAVMAIKARVQQLCGVLVPDEGPESPETPNEIIEFVNRQMRGR